ncbi:UNVERIFIED_CONTAM: hypothetical protein BEN50_11555, partial [Euhalothece sp. KZN 001]
MESAGGTQRVGWINTGDTKDGLWGKLISDDEQTRGKSWQEQQEEIARKIERDRAEEREKLKHALPVDGHSPEFRKLLLQLEIKPEDNQDLINRGLSPEDIKRLLIKSVEPKQEVTGIKPNLPGIYNNRISVTDSGYLCPAFDEYGRIIGCQIRIRDAEDNKYRWLKGKFPSHLLINGNKELPLTVLKGDSKDAYLCEGILKPAIANVVHNKTFIGASGGNFTNSPEQLKRILKAVAKDGKVYFCPDAGFNLNPQVQRRDRATVKLIQSLGYEVYILDWGQLKDKDTIGDIDEISSEVLESAIAIPASEFLKSPEQKLREEEKKAQAQREEEEAGSPVISKDEWLTQKADEFWDNIKKKTGKSFNGFDPIENKKKRDRALSGVKLIYGKDALPTPECSIELPKIQFEQGERLSLSQELFDLGWEDILDTSAPGSGKSHEFNLLSKDVDENGNTQGKTWYLHGDHRNPTVEPAERKADLPSRHNGLIKDNSRTTPSGEPFLRRWQWSEETPEPDIPSNCPETDRFNSLSTKGYNIHAKTEETKNKAQNPICAQCPILHECINTGYKAARKTAMESSELRAHPDSLPSPDEYSYQDDTLIWEEASTQFKPTETRSLSKHDLEQQWEWLERENPEAYDRLRPIKHKLTDILSGNVNLPRFGANTFPDAEDNADLRTLLGVEVYPELESDLLVLKAINDRAVGLEDIEFKQADHVSVSNFSEREKRKWKGLQKTVNSMLRGQARNENRDANAALPTLGLYELILILFDNSEAVANHRKINDIFGHAVINHGELSLTLNNSRHRSIASQAKNNVYLDATSRPQDIAKAVGIDKTKLITIEQRQPDRSNLTIHGIHVEGMKSKDHSDDCNRRKKALVDEIQSRIPETETSAVISFKNDAIEHDGYWFNDSRATNRFKGVNHLTALGTPYQNYGEIKAEYYVTRRTLDGFDEYYNHLKEAEIIQLIGRQRSHLYPDDSFSIYLIGTDLDLTFLEEMGIKVDISHGLEWTPEAGTQSQSLKLNLVQKAIEFGDNFWKLTQTEIAKKLGVTQGRISQLLKSVGGKINLKKLLMSLYESY